MYRNRNLIIILIIVIILLTLALIGAIAYIMIDKSNNSENGVVIDNNIYVEDYEENVNYQEGENIIVEDNNDVVENIVEDEITDENINSLPEVNEDETTTDGDFEKLIFNTTFTPYLGDITGDVLDELLQKIQESNNKNPEHQIVLKSNNLQNLNDIVPTNIYTITFSYDEITGYLNIINIDNKI